MSYKRGRTNLGMTFDEDFSASQEADIFMERSTSLNIIDKNLNVSQIKVTGCLKGLSNSAIQRIIHGLPG